MKWCTTCKCEHELSAFGPDRSRRDGLNVRCLKSAAALKKSYYISKPRLVLSAEVRFWAKVDKTAKCWNWIASKKPRGYGHFFADGKQILAHRFSWELHMGPIPAEQCVLHRCDNPACIRPEHLFLGDYADNARDMTQKGRRYQPKPAQMPRGEAHWLHGKLWGARLKDAK